MFKDFPWERKFMSCQPSNKIANKKQTEAEPNNAQLIPDWLHLDLVGTCFRGIRIFWFLSWLHKGPSPLRFLPALPFVTRPILCCSKIPVVSVIYQMTFLTPSVLFGTISSFFCVFRMCTCEVFYIMVSKNSCSTGLKHLKWGWPLDSIDGTVY